jgi:hypothetical protein
VTDPGSPTVVTVPVQAIQLTSSSSAIGTGQTANITVTLFNASGQIISSPKVVVFTLDAPALGSIASPVTVSGGVSSQLFTARTIEGSVTITASVDNGGTTVVATKTIQISNLVAAASVAVTANPAAITIGGTSVVSATVRDANNNPMPNGTTVNFSVDNTALGTILASSTTTSGVAEATFLAGVASPGTATITATSGSVSGTGTLTINAATAGSIEFLSATPQIISISGAGGQETSEIKFLVKDANGNPIIGSQTVRLILSGPNGGEYLGATAGQKILDVGTVNGIASTIIHSGNIPGTATVTATVIGTALTTSSGVIAIGGGTPSAGHFSLSAQTLNVAGLNIENVTNDIFVLLADRYGNYNVLQGTTVSFYSECGAIDRAAALDAIGQGDVVFRTQTPPPHNVTPDALTNPVSLGSCGPRCDQENAFISAFNNYFGFNISAGNRNPRDGVCSIVAVVDGEEAFVDSNGTGIYDLGEPFVDSYDDIHLDKDDDVENILSIIPGRPHDQLFEDLIVDRNKNGVFNGMNSIWDSNKRISKKIDILFTGEPGLTLSASSLNVPHGGSQTIYFALHDLNFNRPIGGTTLTVSLTGSGTLSGTKTYTYLDSSSLGTPILAVTISDSDPNTNVAVPATLEFSWTWNGNTSVLSFSGVTR